MTRDRRFFAPSAVATSFFVIVFCVISLSCPTQAQSGSFTVKVDALNNCVSMFQSANHNYTPATHHIGDGVYQVTVATDVHYHPGCCEVRKVAFYATTDEQPYGWFHIVSEGTPIYINVTGHGTDPNDIYAFFVDGDCGDNQGTATLTFIQVPALPPICSGKDCN